MFKVKLLFVTLLVTLCSLSLSGQIIDPDLSITETGRTPGFVRELKPKVESTYSRNYFLSERWQIGTVTLKNGDQINDVPLKYDIVKNLLEIKLDENIYFLSAYHIEKFSWLDIENFRRSEFVPCGEYDVEYDEKKPIGFFEKILDGKLKLYIYHDVSVFQANTSISLSGSHRSNDIIWTKSYYVNYNDKLIQLHHKRKPNLYLFNPFNDEILHYMRINGLWFKKEKDVIQVISYYNGL